MVVASGRRRVPSGATASTPPVRSKGARRYRTSSHTTIPYTRTHGSRSWVSRVRVEQSTGSPPEERLPAPDEQVPPQPQPQPEQDPSSRGVRGDMLEDVAERR